MGLLLLLVDLLLLELLLLLVLKLLHLIGDLAVAIAHHNVRWDGCEVVDLHAHIMLRWSAVRSQPSIEQTYGSVTATQGRASYCTLCVSKSRRCERLPQQTSAAVDHVGAHTPRSSSRGEVLHAVEVLLLLLNLCLLGLRLSLQRAKFSAHTEKSRRRRLDSHCCNIFIEKWNRIRP